MKRSITSIGSLGIFLLIAVSLGAHASTSGPQTRADWHAMGTSPCAWWVPLNQPDGSIDINATIRGLRSNGFHCGVFVIEGEQPGNSYAAFQKLLQATQDTNIELWVVIIPPSEGADSLPYRSDYIAWSRALAELSLKYRNFRGFNIDDLDQSVSQKTFTRSYVCSIYAAEKAANPKFLFVPTVYDLDRTVADRLTGCVDGVWLWWVNLEQATGLSSFLENSRLAVEGRFPIYGGVYAHSTSWHKQEPDAEWSPAHKQGNLHPVFEQSLTDTCRYADGAIVWELSLVPGSHLLNVTREFLPGGSSPYAGRCGTDVQSGKH